MYKGAVFVAVCPGAISRGEMCHTIHMNEALALAQLMFLGNKGTFSFGKDPNSKHFIIFRLYNYNNYLSHEDCNSFRPRYL